MLNSLGNLELCRAEYEGMQIKKVFKRKNYFIRAWNLELLWSSGLRIPDSRVEPSRKLFLGRDAGDVI